MEKSKIKDEIPDNVTRIEVLDGSGAYIEIEYLTPQDFEINDPPLQDASAMFIPALRGIGGVVSGIMKVKIKPKSLSRELE